MSDENRKFQSVRGMRDILPDEHDFFTVVKKAVRHRARQAGFRRIATPILEEAVLFERGLGDADAAGKEMYRVNIGENHLAMKPEGTAGICRAYVEHGMASWAQPVQFYYMEPHFRHDRPQKGRFREFRQFGLEVLGARDPSIDAQVILIARKIFEDLLIAERFTLKINTIGSPESRKKYEDALRDFFLPKMRNLSPESQARVEKNPLRILDSKNEDDQILASMAPKFDDFLDAESKEFYEKVKMFLDELGVAYVEDSSLVRGLDYYCDTVFEFVDENGLAVAGGGRYDRLVELLGGQPTPAFGFAGGFDRVASHLRDAGVVPPEKDDVHVYVACLGDAAKGKAIKILSDLHDCGIHAVGAIGKASIKNQLQKADKSGAPWALLLGEVEVREEMIILKNMKEGEQQRVRIDGVVEHLQKLLGDKKLDSWKMGE